MIILEFRYSCDFQFELISVYSSALGDKKILNEFFRTSFPKNISKSVQSAPFWLKNVSKILKLGNLKNTSRKWMVTFLETWRNILDQINLMYIQSRDNIVYDFY